MPEPRENSRIVIIGAGVVGASIAFRLVKRGANVTVLEAGDPGKGSSSVSFAWINARDKNPQAYHDLNRRSLDMWDRFARELGGNVGLTWGGELRWAATERGAARLIERVLTLQTWGYPIQQLDELDVNRLESNLQTGQIMAASYSYKDGHVETTRVISACLDQVEARGAQVRVQTRVTGFKLSSMGNENLHRVVEVETNQGSVACDAVVLAVGPDSSELAAMAGIELPVKYTFGATVITEPVNPIFDNVAVVQTASDVHPQVSMRQLPDGRVMIHGGDGATETGSAGRTEGEAQQLLAVAKRFVPGLGSASIMEVRRGRRPIPQDGHPILGFTDTVPNLYVATMHSGVTLSALVGEMVSMEILDGVNIDLLAPYRLCRFNRHKD